MNRIILTVLIFVSIQGYGQWVTLHPGYDPYSAIIAYDSVIITGSAYWGQSDLLISTDSGETWAPADPFPDAAGTISLTTTDSLIYACTTNGIYRSPKNEFNWTDYSAGISGQPVLKLVAHDTVCFAVFYCQTDTSALNRRTDGDATWSPVSINVPIGNIYDIDYDGNMLVLAGYNGIAQSTDQGASWSLWPDHMFEMTAVTITGDTIIAASKGGIYRKIISTGNVIKVSNGLMPLWNPYGYEYYGEFESFHHLDGHTFVCGETGVYKLHDSNWFWQNTDLSAWTYVLADNSQYLLAAAGYHGIMARPLEELISAIKPYGEVHDVIRLFPNPATDVIHLASENIITNVLIYDHQGRVVHRSSPGLSECAIPVSNLKRGLYFVVVSGTQAAPFLLTP